MLKTAQFNVKGFTMVELLIVVSIIAIMTGALIPSFSAYTKNQELRQAQEQIINDLYTVQNNAMTGKKGNSAANITHWGLKLNANDSSYQYITKTSTQSFAQSCTNPGAGLERTLSLSEGIKSAANTCIFFSLGNGDATFSSTGTSAFYVKRDTKCHKIDVNSAGLIKKVSGFVTCP